jgi:threonine dehydrogenase-like Zn-dependent dehydrogenase
MGGSTRGLNSIDQRFRGVARSQSETLALLVRYGKTLMALAARAAPEGKIDPSVVITDRAKLEEGPELYKKFRDKKDGCIKVLKP